MFRLRRRRAQAVDPAPRRAIFNIPPPPPGPPPSRRAILNIPPPPPGPPPEQEAAAAPAPGPGDVIIPARPRDGSVLPPEIQRQLDEFEIAAAALGRVPELEEAMARLEIASPPDYDFDPDYVPLRDEQGAYPAMPDEFKRDYGDANDSLYVVSYLTLAEMDALRGRMVPNTLIAHNGEGSFHFAPHAQFGRGTTMAHTINGLPAALDNLRIRLAGQPGEVLAERPLYVYELDPDFVRNTPHRRLADLVDHAGFTPREEVLYAQDEDLRDDTIEYYTPLTFDETDIPNDAQGQAEILQLLTYENPDNVDYYREWWRVPQNEETHEQRAIANTGFSNVFDEVHLYTPTGINLNNVRLVDAVKFNDNDTPGRVSRDMYSALYRTDDPAERYRLMLGTADEPRGGQLGLYQELVRAQIIDDEERRYEAQQRPPAYGVPPPRITPLTPARGYVGAIGIPPPTIDEIPGEAAAAPAPAAAAPAPAAAAPAPPDDSGARNRRGG